MKHLLVAISTAIAVGLMASASAVASGGPTLDLSPLQCGPGTLVVNVNQRIVNDADSGVAGNYWAFDTYNRHIKVWQTAPNTFCAIVSYDGGFTTVAGPSPQNTGTVAAGIQGNFKGGYQATFTGTFAATKPTSGNLGTFDYACVLSSSNTVATCPGYQDWTTFYFSSTSGFNENWWGWIYTTEANGTWVNAITGNHGDITGVPPSDHNGGDHNGGDHNGGNHNGDNQHRNH
jgi:hypothetical protein